MHIRDTRRQSSHHSRHLSCDGGQNPKDPLKVQHPPEIRCVLFVQHAKKHNTEQGQVHDEVDEHAPTESIRPSDGTRLCNRDPHSVCLKRR